MNKIKRNMERDEEINNFLRDQGWVVLRFCESRALAEPDQVAREIADIVRERFPVTESNQATIEVRSVNQDKR